MKRTTTHVKPRSLMRWVDHVDPLPLPADTPQTPIDISGCVASGINVILCAGVLVAIYLLAVGW